MKNKKFPSSTSWSHVSKWYSETVGQKGHYFHEKLIIPSVLRIANLKNGDSILDLGCGEGVLARHLPKDISYFGVDIAKSLISEAKRKDHNRNHQYKVLDITKPLTLPKKNFTHAVFILSLQNMNNIKQALNNVFNHLAPNGLLIIVLNHPCFRIPRQSGWGIFEKNKIQYRWVNRYLSPLKIPISTHPGRNNSAVTWTFHQPLSSYFSMLSQTGFLVENLEEWSSEKTSVGSAAKMENRARVEIPLFLTIAAKKLITRS